MKDPVVLVLGAGVHQLDVVRAARRLGCAVWTVDYAAESPAHREADHFWVRSTAEASSLRMDWENSGRPLPDAVLAPGTDVGLLALAELVERWGVVGPTRALVDLVCDKQNFRQWQAAQGLHHPRFFLRPEDWPDQAARAWLVKPARASGTRGVMYGRGRESLREAWSVASAVSGNGRALVEEWIEGVQLTAEGFWGDGRTAWLALTDRLIPDPQNPLTQGHIFPTHLPSAAQEQIREELSRTMQALPFAGGYFDADLVWQNGRAVVLEWTPRLGGNRLARLWPRLGGPDVAEQAVQHALGKPVNPQSWPQPRPGFVELLGAPYRGRVSYACDRLSTAPAHVPGLVEVGVDVSPGTAVEAWRDGRTALGYMIGASGAGWPAREETIRQTLHFIGWHCTP